MADIGASVLARLKNKSAQSGKCNICFEIRQEMVSKFRQMVLIS